MVGIKVAANDDVLIVVGREDFLEWKIATILTARDWRDVYMVRLSFPWMVILWYSTSELFLMVDGVGLV